MNSILEYLDFDSRKTSTCGETLNISESSRDLNWDRVILEVGTSPEFYPNNVCTPYFYFALDTSSGINWIAKRNNSLSEIHSSEGQIWINPPYVPFTHSISVECNFIILAIEEKKFLESSKLWTMHSSKEFQFLNTYNVEDSVIKHFIELFVMEMRAKSRNGLQFIDSLLSAFSDYYIQNYSNYHDHLLSINHDSKSKITSKDIELVRKIILEDLSEKISIEDLSAEIGMSKFYFLREFKKFTGETPYQFILNVKLKESEELLKNPNLKLTDIAYSLGFTDQSHFTNQFRRWKGITPQSFRKSNILQ